MDYKTLSAFLMGALFTLLGLLACNPMENNAVAETGYEGDCGSFTFQSRTVYYNWLNTSDGCADGFTNVGTYIPHEGVDAAHEVCLQDQ
jgi:hypothetical protein